MGIEESWREVLGRHRPPLLYRLGRNDRGEGRQRRSLIMLAAGMILALAAVFLARTQPGGQRPARAAVPTVGVVVAAADIGFGQALTADKLKLVELPVAALPQGHFRQLEAVVQGSGHAALRPIAANEVITAAALAAGGTRLSATPLLGRSMRALAVPVDEVSGVSGLLFPGDRVDVLLTEEPDVALPHAELLAQNVRVLAVGEDMNIARDKPGVVKTATLELTPAQAQKLTLAVATGRISLSLRHLGDEDRIRLESLQLSDLNDGTPTRLIRKPGSGAVPATAPARQAGPSNSVTVMRGAEATAAPVLP
ncbi:Flp pilus assembly protein CpaB [Sandarakinorhabdus oryzae]|uniref:Flp pilus assembly protein CpaB n=1 Tax=Sandarakinorhabdus oryzae TaxID=2675220 RepID=UPI001F2A33F2|nr:Flp pilus assembly protein CpaB [Sandarakinorhabdus oryzae]